MPPRHALSALFSLCLVACAGSTPPAATAATAPALRTLTRAAWQEAQASGAWTPTTLEPVGEPRRLHGPEAADPASAPPGTVWLQRCMPGGSSELFATERATGQVWRVEVHQVVSVPEGVSISATECTAQAVRTPPGGLHGTLRVVGP